MGKLAVTEQDVGSRTLPGPRNGLGSSDTWADSMSLVLPYHALLSHGSSGAPGRFDVLRNWKNHQLDWGVALGSGVIACCRQTGTLELAGGTDL